MSKVKNREKKKSYLSLGIKKRLQDNYYGERVYLGLFTRRGIRVLISHGTRGFGFWKGFQSQISLKNRWNVHSLGTTLPKIPNMLFDIGPP